MLSRARSRRVVAAVGVAVAAVSLAACDKPAQSITAQAGSTALKVNPSTFCSDGEHCKNYDIGKTLPALTIAPDGKVLVDVPKQLVGRGWAINAVDVDGKTQLGNTGAITDSHSYRLTASVNNGKPFIVQVVQLKGNKTDGSLWSFLVKPSATKS
jgi:hypothetical protein